MMMKQRKMTRNETKERALQWELKVKKNKDSSRKEPLQGAGRRDF